MPQQQKWNPHQAWRAELDLKGKEIVMEKVEARQLKEFKETARLTTTE